MRKHAVEPYSARLSWNEVLQLEVLIRMSALPARTALRFELHLPHL
jgi:hypothetical protein